MKNRHVYLIFSSFFLLLCSLITYIPNAHSAGVSKYESWYQDVWCKSYGGTIEARQDDGSRVDCLTENHAIEVEFAKKWREAIGQSLHYALKTEREAGIVLIIQKESDESYWKDLKKTVEHYQLPITLWQLGF